MSGIYRGVNGSAVADALNIDGDKGDLTISNSGLEWNINPDVIDFSKIQNISTDVLLGRATSGSGDIEEITCTPAGRALLDDANASAQRTTLGLGNAATATIGTEVLAYNSNLQTFVNTFTLPTVDSTNGYVLTTNGAGTLSLTAPGGIPDGDKGDITVSSGGTVWSLDASTDKATPIDLDEVVIRDSSSSFSLKKVTWANVKSVLKSYFDSLYATISNLNLKANIASPTFTGLVTLDDGADIASASTVDLTTATGNTVRITGTTAITAFTMNAGQQMELVAVGALPLTYNATSMDINGGVNYTCAAGDRLKVFKDGAGVVRVNVSKQDGKPVTACVDLTTNQTIGGVKTFSSMPVLPMQPMVRVNTANGYGSTNTKIRRFTNVVTNQGTDISYADSATLGASFTINTNGVYAISYSDCFTSPAVLGLSVNSTQLTTNLESITATNVLSANTTGSSSYVGVSAWTGYLTVGDIIRPHSAGGAVGAVANGVLFTITRVS